MDLQGTVDTTSIEQIRNKILNNALGFLSFVLIPVVIISLSRATDVGWQPYMFVMLIVTPLFWGMTFWHRIIPFKVRAFLFISSLFLLGASGYWSTGLIGGGIWGFFIASVMANMLLGTRWSWILLAAIAISMACTALFIMGGFVTYPFEVPDYATNPKVLFSALIIVCSILAGLTASMGKFHNHLLTSLNHSRKRATDLANEIHEREKAEEAQRKSEEKFQHIIENIQDVYFETAIDGTIHYCSPSCLAFSGYTQDELIGQSATTLYHNSEDRQLLLAAIQKEGKVRGLELIFEKKNGSIYDVEFNADITFDNQGNPVGMRGTIRDVTISKQVKERMQRAEKMEAIGLLAGGVAHDLNNIITAIVGYPDLMIMTLPKDSDLIKPLQTIKESGQRAAEVIADLLTVSKGAATNREICDLHKIIDQYLNSPEYRVIKDRYTHVQYSTSLEASEVIIACSPVHIKKCLMNLINNAAESIVGEGSITISTVIHEVDIAFSSSHGIEEGTYALLNIEDNGAGIATEDLKYIFEPFYTKKHLGRSGTGLGLAIVWNTVQNHSGAITVTSDNHGTKFQLYFPLKTGATLTDITSFELSAETLGKGETVLVVDDEPDVRDIASQILSVHGYNVEQVSSGEEAINYLKTNKVDIIVLDMLMAPGINGHQTYERILEISQKQKALISSGFSENNDVEATLKLGAGGFVKKPYTKEQLCIAVRQILDA